MGVEIKLSSKGQVVIPKDIRDALHLKPGETLSLTREGRRIVLEAHEPADTKISYAEFRRRVPKYSGPAVKIDDMTSRIGDLYRDWKV